MFKELLVNTGLGLAGMAMREQVALHKAALSDLENLGMMGNDLLARTLLERLCEPGGIFIDVGSHIGSVIAGVMRQSEPSRIIAIEAIPEKAAALRERFPNAEIIETAVSDHVGQVEFTIDLVRPGFSSLNPELQSQTTASQVIVVPLTTLDAILPHKGVDLIKIDVEGAELGVLRGAETVASQSRPVIMFESGATEMAGFPRAELWQWFADHDYEVALPMRVAHTAPGLSLETFVAGHDYPRFTTNYYGIPNERRHQIRQRARKLLKFD